MVKKVILFLFLMVICVCSFAEQITVDGKDWDQTKKNMLQSMVVLMLAEKGVTYENIDARYPVINIDKPTDDISFLTTDSIGFYYDIWRETQDVIDANSVEDLSDKIIYMKNSELLTLSFNDIDSFVDDKIDTGDTEQIKEMLKELLRYIKAKE